jgi:serine/threonine protein kinase
MKLSDFGLCKPVRAAAATAATKPANWGFGAPGGSCAHAQPPPHPAGHDPAPASPRPARHATHATPSPRPTQSKPVPAPQVDVSSLPTLREGEEFTDANGQPAEATAGSRPQAEQLEHWQRNRRQLAYSTVGTPDYIAPGGAGGGGGVGVSGGAVRARPGQAACAPRVRLRSPLGLTRARPPLP